MTDTGPTPTWSKPCEACNTTVERFHGEGDVHCTCGAWYNAAGQRLRDDWRSDLYDDTLDDMEAFERMLLAQEQGF